MLFENGVVRVWDLTLEPGQRAPFHTHTVRYFWTCVKDGIADQRTLDGVVRRRHTSPPGRTNAAPGEPVRRGHGADAGASTRGT